MKQKPATIQDYIDHNENTKIQIARKFSRDECDPLFETLWQGMLYDTPSEYRSLEVFSEGWLIGAQCNQITVLEDIKR